MIISIPFFLITGIVCFVLMIAVSGLYAKMVGNSDVQLPIIALSPIVLFGCLMSIYRGYFEGMRYMVPTAVSEIIEVSGKLGSFAFVYCEYMGKKRVCEASKLYGC